MSPILRGLLSIALGSIATLAVACSTSAPADPSPSPVPPTATLAPTPTARPAASSAAEATPEPEYTSQGNMFELFSGPGHSALRSFNAIRAAGDHKDPTQVAMIVEYLPFMFSLDLAVEAGDTLEAITGLRFGGALPDRRLWTEWVAEHADDYPLPDGYVRWKAGLFSMIDPRFDSFFLPHGEAATINMFEVTWGGVPPDGIPDLQFPPHIPAGEATYLFRDDRVFGVSINGEHRAYPLRIVNAHEMANDVLGGEPIALAY